MATSKKGRGRTGRAKAAQLEAPRNAATGTIDVDAAIEAETQEIGRELFANLERNSPSIFERRWWDDRILSWAMADESVKVQMFRFVDVLPMLHTHEAVTRHLQEYFDEVRSRLPLAVRLGLEISQPNSVLGKALALNARSNSLRMSQRFIAGAKVEEVLAAVTKLRKQGFAFTLDLLGEATTSERDADAYQRAYLELIEGMAGEVQSWSEVPRLDRDHEGSIPRVNLSLKLSALYSQFRPIDVAGTSEHVKRRLRPLLRAAREHDAYIHVDMEQYAYKDLTFEIFKEILMEDEFRDFPDVGIVVQAYLPEAPRDTEALLEWATARGTPIWVRLVKGAYWDYETIMAQAHGWPVPVYQQKWESDANFERLTRFLMENHRWLRPALGSHNLRSLSHGIACAKHLGVPEGAYELQMLYGMGGDQAQLLADRGQRVRIYTPFGELIPGMAYLVRRLLENTSNDSFLRQSFTEQVSIEDLLMKPTDAASRPAPARVAPRVPAEPAYTFTNEAPTDFSRAEARRAMERAVKDVAEEFGKDYPLVINGRAIETMGKIKSINPSHKSQVVGVVSSATAEDASLAIDAARRAFKQWSRTEPEHRAEYLELAAATMRNQRFELAAWEVHECGKPWIEADADVAEAIDFCMYYAEQARRLMSGRRCDLPGEENNYSYRPRGVAAVIAPWNFPLAILTGMTAAALVTGNTVIMKPAEQSSMVGYKLMEILQNVGIPDGVVNYLPGVGEEVGPELVGSPDVNLIAFTGSRTVGLAINHEASRPDDRQEFVKHVIAEMGGKNAIIIDDDADLDEAVLGVAYSAFGYAGQKCSACSRCIVLESVYNAFVEKLAQATLSLKVGPAELPDTTIGPVIDEDSLKRINEYIKLGKESFPLLAAGAVKTPTSEGYYIGPHVFGDVDPASRLASEEIFGPVLAVIKVKDLDEAFDVANDSAYALTGGMFSRSPANLKRARQELQAGNVYLNRGITGAMVERQPFGGFKLSGIGTKAGGPDYLLQFVIPINITENTFRRGFAPPADDN